MKLNSVRKQMEGLRKCLWERTQTELPHSIWKETRKSLEDVRRQVGSIDHIIPMYCIAELRGLTGTNIHKEELFGRWLQWAGVIGRRSGINETQKR